MFDILALRLIEKGALIRPVFAHNMRRKLPIDAGKRPKGALKVADRAELVKHFLGELSVLERLGRP